MTGGGRGRGGESGGKAPGGGEDAGGGGPPRPQFTHDTMSHTKTHHGCMVPSYQYRVKYKYVRLRFNVRSSFFNVKLSMLDFLFQYSLSLFVHITW